ncbi:MAG: cobalt-precorrin-5B (C(1))-methyltransferase [Rhodospirillales bacterium]|nr:cobalt-precorrin-5B (C(1))-methyltransferase [Rhodospirillales bacterium]
MADRDQDLAAEAPAIGAPDRDARPDRPLRKGWTTGACAAAARAAFEGLVIGQFPDPVSIVLPRGQRPEFALARRELAPDRATAGVIKDAGDDPDVTHGALVLATVEPGPLGSGIAFRAGDGVGTVTRPGLTLPPGEPAINPGPRDMIRRAIRDAINHCGGTEDVVVTVSIPGGAALAEKTLNRRLGIVGGLSILGTTGVVVPFSCAAWIHSIHRGIDVARAAGLTHLAASTGSTSEAAVKALYGLPDEALIDMGDFAGGTFKYLRNHPVERLTVAGGFGKLAKLAAGHLDLHSGRSSVDIAELAALAAGLGAAEPLIARLRAAVSAGEVLQQAAAAGLPLADAVACRARDTTLATLAGNVAVEVVVFDRTGRRIGHAGP